ncbi:hypothetical protein TDB9533_04671 [Thalassocella blandensis]|nr:hypothetical protein TDB9533_04671 [Thalassocella blandensis]
MATLVNSHSKQTVILRTNHTFGRNAEGNTTVLHSLSASRNHASIVWDGESWRIKDISSNGTFIDGNIIAKGHFIPLSLHASIQFGIAQSESWEVTNLDPPVTGLIPANNTGEIIPLHDVFILPIESQEIMVNLGEDGRWLCTTEQQAAELHSGDMLGGNGSFWYFVDARPSEATAIHTDPPPNNIQFQFFVSRNEEHVTLKLVSNNRVIDLGERNHHYLLLLLARQRVEDLKQHYPEAEQGWIKKDLLVKMMGMAEQHINIHIHRFRKQVSSDAAQPSMLHQVIERRPGELRFAYSDILIEGGISAFQ